MPEVDIQIGGRTFQVSCQPGEEHYLHSAAKMLDDEAAVLATQTGRIPEARMLLMAGLMLADKTAGMQDKLREAEDKMAEKEAELAQMRNAPTPAPERIEVPVVPGDVTDALAEIAARTEALAEQVAAKRAD
ncbi:cell division protein ZapA [Roseovarius sp. LXJ103]|uniref:cell division protein ZapA n=1 Tax=Roseovarius carneus TaxID=2853164 RepID=UPI000D6228EC|nr:cell division protein ZapA [Roseovarius carneus]MBZ8119051.1 cell division protein ZapA [Roseovarius carneus]PWE35301.1 cell division protein ZapA [Pelagicola sp. LXJ1103]